jgi:metal-responsive CopG/Arc/MetJ family transcriptional regulator
MPRTAKLLTISLPPDLYIVAERVAKEEGRTRSELFREALREYLLTRDVRQEAKKRLSAALQEIWAQNRGRDAEQVERVVREAVKAVRRRRRGGLTKANAQGRP